MNIPNVTVDKPNQFPWKLFDMLYTAEKRNEEHIISWIRNGKAFKVHDRDLFIEHYMKKMFNQTKFKSFQRQLNLWGFERIQNGPDKGSYFHPLFVKGQRESCQRLSRVRLKGSCDKAIPYGTLDKSETSFNTPSVSSTAAETVSTMGAATFPSKVNASAVDGRRNTTTDSPVSLLGAFVDVSQPTTSSTTKTNSLGDSRSDQFADLIEYHTSKERREMIRNAAMGLSPDLSMVVVGTPVYASATDTSHLNIRDHDIRYKEAHEQGRNTLSSTYTMDQRGKDEPSEQRQQQESSLLQQRHKQTHPDQNLQIDLERQSTSSGLEALLSVSAQRRREEELALLMKLSDPKAMSHMR